MDVQIPGNFITEWTRLILKFVFEENGWVFRRKFSRMVVVKDDEGAAETVGSGDADHPLEQLKLQILDEFVLDFGNRILDACAKLDISSVVALSSSLLAATDSTISACNFASLIILFT